MLLLLELGAVGSQDSFSCLNIQYLTLTLAQWAHELKHPAVLLLGGWHGFGDVGNGTPEADLQLYSQENLSDWEFQYSLF